MGRWAQRRVRGGGQPAAPTSVTVVSVTSVGTNLFDWKFSGAATFNSDPLFNWIIDGEDFPAFDSQPAADTVRMLYTTADGPGLAWDGNGSSGIAFALAFTPATGVTL